MIYMNRRTIRIAFADYKCPFDPERNFVLDILRRRYDVDVCDNPDFLVDMGLGHNYINYDCVKLLISGENSHPDFGPGGSDPCDTVDVIRSAELWYNVRHEEIAREQTQQGVSPDKQDCPQGVLS